MSQMAFGVITVVQEHRFELLAEDGTRRRFTLAHGAPLGWNELVNLERDGARVAVRHEAARPGSTSLPAQALWRLQPADPEGPS